MATKNILFLSTGGTIAGQTAELGPDGQAMGAEGIKGIAQQALDHISDKWKSRVEPHAQEIANVDSSDVLPEVWTSLANAIHERYDEFDGFVITHGTNTMAYTAAALAFAIANSAKPIVVTGSQIPAAVPGSDGKANIDNALRIAAYPERYHAFGGVLTVFGSHIITGVRTKKSTEFDIDAFSSFTSSSIGRIGRVLEINDDNLRKHMSYLKKDQILGNTKDDLVVRSAFDMRRIISLTEFPGMDAELLISMLGEPGRKRKEDVDPIRGVVFRAFGAGDASKHMRPFFQLLREREIPVVVTTQAPNGKATLQVNEPGQYLAEHDLAIAAHDMSIESMTVKLGWLLAQGHSYGDIKRLMGEDLRGEINEHRDLPW